MQICRDGRKDLMGILVNLNTNMQGWQEGELMKDLIGILVNLNTNMQGWQEGTDVDISKS